MMLTLPWLPRFLLPCFDSDSVDARLGVHGQTNVGFNLERALLDTTTKIVYLFIGWCGGNKRERGTFSCRGIVVEEMIEDGRRCQVKTTTRAVGSLTSPV